DLRPASGGALQLAAALSICTYVLPDVLKRFQAAHPKVMITVRSGHSEAELEMVLGGEAGSGLARSLQHPEVETLSVRDDPRLLSLELSDAEPLSRSLDVIHPRQRPLSHEALALLKTLRAAVGEEADAPPAPRRRTRKAAR